LGTYTEIFYDNDVINVMSLVLRMQSVTNTHGMVIIFMQGGG